MNSEQLRILAQIVAASARVMGMVAENMQREHLGQAMAYDEHPFFVEAHGLEALAQQAATSA